MSITKDDISNHIVNKFNLQKKNMKVIVNSIFSSISNSLLNGEEVKITNFGKFAIRQKTARPGRNPKTGEEANISARTIVCFQPGPNFKEFIGSYKE